MINWIPFKRRKPKVLPHKNYFRSKKILILYGNDIETAEIFSGYYEKGYYETDRPNDITSENLWEKLYDPFICDSLEVDRAFYWAEFNLPNEIIEKENK